MTEYTCPPGLTLLFLDHHCAVVEKPSGLLAVPGRGPEKQDCVAARLRQICRWCIQQPAAHRLDQDTSGLMVFGLTGDAQRRLSRQFAERRVQKGYVAMVEEREGKTLAELGDSGEIRLAFRLDPDNRPHQIHDPEQGKWGVTRWKKLWQEPGKIGIALRPLTGRTHQLRLHASHPLGLNRPIVGDRLYGIGGTATAPGQLRLHAAFLAFTHPQHGRPMRFFSVPPWLDAERGAKAAQAAAFAEEGELLSSPDSFPCKGTLRQKRCNL